MIVIPMAGLSSRFRKAGYRQPKYMLELDGKTLFEHSIASFSGYFSSEHFLFIGLDSGFAEADFIHEQTSRLNLTNSRVVMLDGPTKGQAETVFFGLQNAGISDQPITIFNIDTFRPDFTYPESFSLAQIDGYLETFIGTGSNWSNVVPSGETDRVSLTAEKQSISQYCCTGLYYWKSSEQFCDIFRGTEKTSVDKMQGNEYYIAPMYNNLIAEQGDVRFTVVDRKDVIFCGTPDEYHELKAQSAEKHHDQ